MTQQERLTEALRWALDTIDGTLPSEQWAELRRSCEYASAAKACGHTPPALVTVRRRRSAG